MFLESLKKRNAFIKDEWEKFIEGKPVNPDVVSSRIKQSWERSRSYGVDPFAVSEKEGQEDTPVHSLVTNAAVKEYLRKQINKYGYSLQLFDQTGTPVTAPTEVVPASEQRMGTNPIWFALTNNRPSFVYGCEHYHSLLHDNYTAAAPIHDGTGKTIGAISILCKDIQLVPATLPLVTQFASLLGSVNTLLYKNSDETMTESVFNCLPQGIAYFKNGRMRFHNDRLLDILQLRNTDNALEVIEKHLSHLANGVHLNRNQISMYIEGRKNDVFVTTIDHIPAKNAERYQVVLLENAKNVVCHGTSSKDNHLQTFDKIIGKSAKLMAAKKLAQKIAGANLPVLLLGESGTGKELFAQAIHSASQRNNGPFVAINCGAIPAELVESELFGYEPGSFTGSLKNGKQGLLEFASGGTVFLDEIESMPMPMQVKLLRAISEGKIVKVGGTREIPIDVRIISASKKDLLAEADKESFREDLYYRISTFVLELPSLRERRDDIPMLAKYFIEKHQKNHAMGPQYGSDDFFEALTYYHWRGNVRELKNVLERVIYLANQQELTVYDLPDNIQKAYRYKSLKETLSGNEALLVQPEGMIQIGEEIIIESVLKETQFNISKSSEMLGISPKTLYNKINSNPKLSRLKADHNPSLAM